VKKRLRKTSVRFDANPAMTVFRSRRKVKRVAYVLCADKPLKYGKHCSRIIYIGESGKKGLGRPATSAYRKADQAFGTRRPSKKLRSVTEIDVYLLTFRRRQRVRLWEVLERDLLATFKELYDGALPCYNNQGKGKGFSVGEIKLIRKKRLEAIIKSLETEKPVS
jgi:hypothetical protein